MHTIYKFPVPENSTFVLKLPARARFLDVQVQRGKPQAWFLLDPEAETVRRRFVVCGTGHQVPEQEMLTYLGTFQLFDGELVLHLFEYDAERP